MEVRSGRFLDDKDVAMQESAIIRPRIRASQPMLDLNDNSQEDAPTPFQRYTSSRYSSLPESIRPPPNAFLPVDPAFSANEWKVSTPSYLRTSVRSDSAVDIVAKLQMRANGGTRIIDSHATPITDLFSRTESTTLACPKNDGAHYLVELPKKEVVEKRIKVYEANEQVAEKLNKKLPEGHRFISTYMARLALGSIPSLGEKSARVFAPSESVPHFSSPFGKRLESFTRLALRMEDPNSVSGILAKELNAIARIELPERLVSEVAKFAGDRYTRSAALGDRMYHALAIHPSIAGACRIRIAPLHAKSYGENTPPPWQTLRTALRCIAHATLSLDLMARRLAYENPEQYSIGYKVSGNALSQFKVVNNSITVMAQLQQDITSDNGLPDALTKLKQRRILDASAFEEGGIKDLMVMRQRSLLRDAALQESISEDIISETRLDLNIRDISAICRSAVLKPKVSYVRSDTADDIELYRRATRSTVSGISKEELNKSSFTTVTSLGALLRYGISICYMVNKPEVRLNVACYVKQWNIISRASDPPASHRQVSRHASIVPMLSQVVNSHVVSMIQSLLPYCSLKSEDNLMRKITRIVGMPEMRTLKRDNLTVFLYSYFKTRYADHERITLRNLCGRLVHAGMSDTGLMLSIRKAVEEERALSSVMMEHMRYKIGVWKSNYAAHLRLANPDDEAESERPEMYKKMITWQQKLNMLSIIELKVHEQDSTFSAYVRKSALNEVLLDSYRRRHDKISKRLVKPDPDRPVTSKWVRDSHPWGEQLSEERKLQLVSSEVSVVLDFLAAKDGTFWVLDPLELKSQLDDMLKLVIFGLETALEGSNIHFRYDEDEERRYGSIALPEKHEISVTAAFQFSLADPPSRRESSGNAKRVEVMGKESTRKGSAVLHNAQHNAAKANTMLMMKRNLASARAGGSQNALALTTSRSTTVAIVEKEYCEIGLVMRHVKEQLRPYMLNWLSSLADCRVTDSTTTEVLPKKYRCYVDEAEEAAVFYFNEMREHIRKQRVRQARAEVTQLGDDIQHPTGKTI